MVEPSRFGEEQPRTKKSGPSGCTILLLIFLGLGVLGVAVVGVAVYQALQDPQLKEAMSAVSSMVAAQGRPELEAAGCDAAVVVDMRPFAKLAKQNPNNRPEEIEALGKAVFINCVLMNPKPGLTCERLAVVYRDAIKNGPTTQPEEVSVFIQAQGAREPICSGRYDAGGVFLGEALPPPSAAGGAPPSGVNFRFGTTPPQPPRDPPSPDASPTP